MLVGRSGRRKGIRMGLVPWEESVKKGRSILVDSHLESPSACSEGCWDTQREAGGAWILLAKSVLMLTCLQSAWRETGDSSCHLTAILSLKHVKRGC